MSDVAIMPDSNVIAISNLSVALLWRERGFSVLPILPESKKPARAWIEGAEVFEDFVGWGAFTTDQTELRIREHWARHPDHLVAVVTGDAFVIDIDDATSDLTYQTIIKPMGVCEPFCTMRTSRGMHYWYRLPDGLTERVSSRGKAEVGHIDIKTGKSYCVVSGKSRLELEYDDTPGAHVITTDQIAMVYACNGEVWPFVRIERERKEWDGDRKDLVLLKLHLDALPCAESFGYDPYMKLVCAVRDKFDDCTEALELLADWSSDPQETYEKWDTFTPGRAGGVTYGTLCDMVRNHGGDLEALSAQAAMMCRFESVSVPLPSAPPAPAPMLELMHFDSVVATAGVAQSGDHMSDACDILRAFDGRLRAFQSEPYWWNNASWESIEPDDIKAKIDMYCTGGVKVTNARTEGIYKTMIRRVPKLGQPTDDYRVYFRNGVYDIAAGTLEPHNPYNLNRATLSFDYEPDATCATWMRFVNATWPEGADCVDLLHEWLGYNLVTSYQFQKFLIMIGVGGTGKGTIGRVMRGLVGPLNYAGTSLHALSEDTTLHSLQDKPTIFIGDAESVETNSRSRCLVNLKSITGCDELTWNRKFMKAASGTLPGRITMACNGLPRFTDAGGALARRMMILPFNHSVEKHDPKLTEKLMDELPGIALMAIEGLRRLLANKLFTIPEASAKEWEVARDFYTPLHSFVTQAIEVGGYDDAVSSAQIYQRFLMWSSQVGNHTMSQQKLTVALRDHFRSNNTVDYTKIRFPDGVLWGFRGLKLV